MGPRITPWRDNEEWSHIKTSFFPRDQSIRDNRLVAIARVKAWSVRGRVPHAVISTAMLTSALLRDQTAQLSTLESRMLLAMALTRFVNGLLDPAQQAVFAISMTSLAKSIELPEAFVEIRHSATHDSLPSLSVLRPAMLRALDWLWHHYWNSVPPSKSLRRVPEDAVMLREQLGSVLRRWRRLRKSEPNRPIKSGDADSFTKQSITLLKELKNVKVGPVASEQLSEALFEPKNLLSKTSGGVSLWKPLLDVAMGHFPKLLTKTILYGISVLGSDHAPQYTPDPHLLGEAVPAAQMVTIPNVDGSYARLQNWILFLIQLDDQQTSSSLDTKQISEALALQLDPYTLYIMEHIKDRSGFESISNLLLIRKKQGPEQDYAKHAKPLSIHDDDILQTSQQRQPNTATDDSEFLEWRKLSTTDAPIGYLIT